jgi:hypothetical protein
LTQQAAHLHFCWLRLGECSRFVATFITAMAQQPEIFVLDIAQRPAFAFAADSLDGARCMARSDWMLLALDRFCRVRRPGAAGQFQLRCATDSEAAVYHDRADEFADPTAQILIAHLVES